MRLFIFLFLSIFVLEAEDNTKKMYAKIVVKSATLYEKPYEYSKKRVAYFKRGDIVTIEYCGSQTQHRWSRRKKNWCKTEHGYIKSDVLSLELETPSIPYEKKKKVTIQATRTINTQHKDKLVHKKPPVALQKNTKEKQIRLIPYKKKKTIQDPYNEYFYRYKSRTLIIEEE